MLVSKFICSIIGCIFFTGLLATSCTPSGNKANILPPDIQYTADTMFSHRRNKIIKEMDSLCAARDSLMIQIKVDSIVALEQERIKAIKGE